MLVSDLPGLPQRDPENPPAGAFYLDTNQVSGWICSAEDWALARQWWEVAHPGSPRQLLEVKLSPSILANFGFASFGWQLYHEGETLAEYAKRHDLTWLV